MLRWHRKTGRRRPLPDQLARTEARPLWPRGPRAKSASTGSAPTQVWQPPAPPLRACPAHTKPLEYEGHRLWHVDVLLITGAGSDAPQRRYICSSKQGARRCVVTLESDSFRHAMAGSMFHKQVMRVQGLLHQAWRPATSHRMAHPRLSHRMAPGRTTPPTGTASRTTGMRPPRARPSLTAAAQLARYPPGLGTVMPCAGWCLSCSPVADVEH